MKRLLRLLPLLLLAALAVEAPRAQGIFDRIKDAAERGVERAVDREVQRQADRATTAAIGAVEDAVVCAVTDEACIEEARRSGHDVVLTDAQGNPVDAQGNPVESTAEAVIPAAPGTGVWANYDFVPGNRVLFYEDYSDDRVGNFPARLEFVDGNWEIVEWQGRRLLRTTGPRYAAFRIVLPEALPERFTIETEAYFPGANHTLALLTQPPRQSVNQVDYNYLLISGMHGTGVQANRNQGLSTSLNKDRRIEERLMPIRIIVDGDYAKVFVGENRTANVPNAVLPRTEALQFVVTYGASERSPMYIGAIRVAASETSLYDALMAEGRVATQGIFFTTGSARIRPVSTPTLREMTQMLQEHPDLRLRIEGHTDNTGSDATNQALSQQRAEAVRDYLVEQGISASRLEAVGLGSSQPVADNATAEGRQRNRRVELIRL